jgi:hypothetical protein
MAHLHACPQFPESRSILTGAPVNLHHASALIGAATDGCRPCQSQHIATVLAGPPEVIVCLAGAAYIGMLNAQQAIIGRLGPHFAAETEAVSPSAATTLTPSTRVVFAAFDRNDPAGAEGIVRDMARHAREEVLNDAVDQLVGLVTVMTSSVRPPD